MVYPYRCNKCSHNFDVVKSYKLLDQPENCDACGDSDTTRLFSPRITILGAKVEDAEYNPGLGTVTRNTKHRNEIAKRMGLIEVGNESTDTLYKESTLAAEQRREREWDAL